MIRITDKQKCCGCEACAQSCPKQCITMVADNEGFLYPKVDLSICIDCGLCEKVCPELDNTPSKEPIKVIAAKALDEDILMRSSSGGIFTLLSNKILEDGGVVFGAKFDKNWNVVHDYTETYEGLDAFRRSKYVQSRIGNTYKKAEEFLKCGRKVLFSGTPCQIKGLKLYLKKDYENLIAVDIACHGVPSPLSWDIFLKEYIKDHPLNKILEINFRDKRNGWETYNFTVSLMNEDNTKNEIAVPYGQNIYMRAFLKNLILRPSCENCNIKTEQNGGDLTIGDFWGIKNIIPNFYDNKGISIVLCRTTKGVKIIDSLKGIIKEPAILETAIPYNGGFSVNIPSHRNRLKYFKGLHKATSFSRYTKKNLRPTLKTLLKNRIKQLILK